MNGDTRWIEGQVENVSRSGILFRASRILPVNTSVEVRFPLAVIGGSAAHGRASVYCRGRVVRHGIAAEQVSLQAVTIREYRIVRGDV